MKKRAFIFLILFLILFIFMIFILGLKPVSALNEDGNALFVEPEDRERAEIVPISKSAYVDGEYVGDYVWKLVDDCGLNYQECSTTDTVKITEEWKNYLIERGWFWCCSTNALYKFKDASRYAGRECVIRFDGVRTKQITDYYKPGYFNDVSCTQLVGTDETILYSDYEAGRSSYNGNPVIVSKRSYGGCSCGGARSGPFSLEPEAKCVSHTCFDGIDGDNDTKTDRGDNECNLPAGESSSNKIFKLSSEFGLGFWNARALCGEENLGVMSCLEGYLGVYVCTRPGCTDGDGDGYFKYDRVTCAALGARDDCDDSNASIHPRAKEKCNRVDDDCDNVIDIDITSPEDLKTDPNNCGKCFRSCGECGNCENGRCVPASNCKKCGDENKSYCYEGNCTNDKDKDSFIPAGIHENATCLGDCNDNNASINPDAKEICNKVDDDCDGYVDMTLIKKTADYCTLCCQASADYCTNGSCTFFSKACNERPGIEGLDLGILYRKLGGTSFKMKAFGKLPIEKCTEGIIAGDYFENYEKAEKMSTVGLKDIETEFDKLKFFVGNSKDDYKEGLEYTPVPEIADSELPLEKKFWLKVEDKGVSIPNSPDSDPKSAEEEVIGLLCPEGDIDLGTYTRRQVWAGSDYNKEGIDFGNLWDSKNPGKVEINVKKMKIHISPDNKCGIPDLEINIYIRSSLGVNIFKKEGGGKEFMDSIKTALRNSGVPLYIEIANKLPMWGDGTITIKTVQYANPTSEKFVKLSIIGDQDFKKINMSKEFSAKEAITLIIKIFGLINAPIECEYTDKKTGKTIKEYTDPKTGKLVSYTKRDDPPGYNENKKDGKTFCNLPDKDGNIVEWLKGKKAFNSDGSFVSVEYMLYDPITINYDKAARRESTIDEIKLFKLFECCSELANIKEEVKNEEKIKEESNKQSIYALRTNEAEYNGYAYQFSPSPLYFNKNVTRIFDKTIYTTGEIDNLSLFQLNETEAFNKCKSYVSDSITYEIQPDKNNTIEFAGLLYEIPKGAVDKKTNITINLLYLYDCYCNNGIQDNNEEGIDCGGECVKECGPTCYDGIQNGNEEGIDCGGECLSCDYIENYTSNPRCTNDQECSGFCGNIKPICLYNTCFCMPKCGNKNCDDYEIFFNICKEDCPACNAVADSDSNCRISFYEVIMMIRKWVGRDISLQDVLDSINLWLGG